MAKIVFHFEEAGLDYCTAGENIAGGQSGAPQVVNAWMNSETHRGNILEESYEYLATGYAAGGAYGTNYCQNFLGDW